MWHNVVLLLGVLHGALAVWQCTSDSDCASVAGSACIAGACGCPATQQVVAGGSRCADFAPYLTSRCVDDYQCERLFTAFQCRRNAEEIEGNCFCQPNHHYFLGRCWPTSDMGEPCTRDEECMGVTRDPYSMTCDQTCACAEGYYMRQRGECRRIGEAVGDPCVLDEDCRFADGFCDDLTFTCFAGNNTSNTPVLSQTSANATNKMAVAKMADSKMATRQNGVLCSAISPCNAPYQCSSVGICVCPLGYYPSEDGTDCYAELGSPSTEEQCVGILAVVENGVCTCPANFFFDEGMRDCTKVARRITDFCMSDEQCHSFGAASYCGEPGQWGLRNCACDLEDSVWDSERNMCRLFAGVGENCEVDSDCLAGELEIQCQLNDAGQGVCTCPDNLVAIDGLCLTSGLDLGDACQVTQECSATENTICAGGLCACDNGYQQVDDFCAPTINGTCAVDADCVIENTVCADAGTCQCDDGFAEYSDQCWASSPAYNSNCTVDAQCKDALGPSGACIDGVCLCGSGHHYRDDACWPITGLFETCDRSSQCFLGELTNTVVCRNSLCQCDFSFPYSEELGTCISSATAVTSSMVIIIAALAFVFN